MGTRGCWPEAERQWILDIMARTPPLSAAAAADRIADRRAAADDSALEMLPDDPLGIARHVLTHRKVPVQVLCADTLDALSTVRAIRAELDRDELSLLRLARQLDITWQAIAGAYGLKTRQAAEQRAIRLEAGKGGGKRAEYPMRTRRQLQHQEDAWLLRNALRILACAKSVAGLCAIEGDLAEAADQLADAVADPDSTPRHLMSLLNWAARAHDAAPPHASGPDCGPISVAVALLAAWPQPPSLAE
jgi:hypothetical protein